MKILSILVILFTSSIYSQEVYRIIIQKEQQKRQSRWTLSDWLFTKQRMALMDQWLALNTKSLSFEYIIDYGQGKYDLKSNGTELSKESQYGGLSLYYKLFGFSYDYVIHEDHHKEKLLGIHVRFLGNAVQSTNIEIQGGRRVYTSTSLGEFDQNYYGVAATFYLFSFLGIDGLYRNYLEGDGELNSSKLSGELIEYGAFLDIFIIRFYGKIFSEKFYHELSSSKSSFSNEGVKLGAKLFF